VTGTSVFLQIGFGDSFESEVVILSA